MQENSENNTKKWDVSATPEKKNSNIPKLMKQIQSQWCMSDCLLKVALTSSYDESARLQDTIENTQPESTATKTSRFHSHDARASFKGGALAPPWKSFAPSLNFKESSYKFILKS